jgi:alkylation response protein AidB-like acyl-CoA dehydrogenase
VTGPDLDQFRTRARAFLAEPATAQVAPRDYGAIMPPDLVTAGRRWQRHLHDHGFAGIAWPEQFGGQGLSGAHNAVWLEEAALAHVPPYVNMVGLVLAGGAILAFGDVQQQEQHLHATLRGEVVWCQLFSEPGAGSDLAGLATRAERDGDEWVVNGQKVWSSGARVSDHGILLARTDPAAAKHRGISFFLCDMTRPGVEVRPLRQMTGETEFDEVFLTDVRLPASGLLGPENEGWAVAMSVLANERGSVGASIIGLERRLAAMTALAERAPNPVQRDRLARLVARGQTFRMSAERARSGDTAHAPVMKLGISELGFDGAMLRAEIAGARAMLAGPEASQVLAAPGGRIAGGTSQVQRNIIGERLLGLPKEPAPAEQKQ